MAKDIRLLIGFLDHPKTIKLQRVLGSDGVLALIRLWSFAAQYRTDGNLGGMDSDDIEIACKWNGMQGALLTALLTHKWIDERIDQNGVKIYLLHDWEDHQGYIVHEKDRVKQAKKAATKRWERKVHAHSNAHSNADSIHSAMLETQISNAPSPNPYPFPSPNPKKKKPIADAPKKGTSPNPEIKLFLDYAFDTFQQTFSEKMLIDGGKDSSLIKKLLSTYSFDRLKELWDVFMKSDDPFICQAGRTIGVFKTQINKLISGDSGSGSQKSLFQQTESPIDKAMRRM
jgi:hypothetical protein